MKGYIMCDRIGCCNESTRKSDEYGSICDECFAELCLYIDLLRNFSIYSAITNFMKSTLKRSNLCLYLETIFKDERTSYCFGH